MRSNRTPEGRLRQVGEALRLFHQRLRLGLVVVAEGLAAKEQSTCAPLMHAIRSHLQDNVIFQIEHPLERGILNTS